MVYYNQTVTAQEMNMFLFRVQKYIFFRKLQQLRAKKKDKRTKRKEQRTKNKDKRHRMC